MRRTRAIALIIGSLLTSFVVDVARSQSADEIVDALTPARRTRSLRGITVENEQIKPPSINLQVLFEYDSDRLTNEGMLTLRRLGNALSDPKMASYRFRIAGHTDAKGAVDYNQKLSERRAAAVKTYLVQEFKLAPSRVETVGFGKSQLIDPSHPEDGINRRVEIINVGNI